MAMIAPLDRKSKLFITVLVALAALLLAPTPARTQGEIGIEISPTSLTPTIAVGDETREQIRIRNSSAAEMLVTARTRVQDSGSGDDLQLEVYPAEIRVAPGDTAEATLSIKVAPGAESGSSKAAALFLAEPLTERDVSIAGQVAVNVDVALIRPLEAVSLTTPRFSDANGTMTFAARARNNGNFPTALKTTVSLTGLFADDLVLKASSDQLAVGEEGAVELEWTDTPAFAIRRLHHSVSTGVGAPVENDGFLIIAPWRLALMLLVIASATLTGIFLTPLITNVFPLNGRKTE